MWQDLILLIAMQHAEQFFLPAVNITVNKHDMKELDINYDNYWLDWFADNIQWIV